MKLSPLFSQVFMALLLLLLGGRPSIAQIGVSGSEGMPESAQPASEPGQHPNAEADGLIHLDVVVTDAVGKPVNGLEAKDFELLDNGQPQTTLTAHGLDGISVMPDPTVEVIFFIDTVGATHDPRAQGAVAEAAKFMRQNDGRLTRAISVFGVSDSGLWTLDHTSSDGNAIADDLIHYRGKLSLDSSSRGNLRGAPLESLAFRDPPYLAALKAVAYIATEERRKPGRKLLFWIGPGSGIGSGAYPGKISDGQNFDLIVWFSTLLREARMEISTFSVGESDPRSLLYKEYLNGVRTPPQASFMYLYKNVLAVESGGQVFQTGGDLVKQMNDCVRNANAYYTVSFNPAPAAHKDEFHDLKVKLRRPGLTARTTLGYYDQPYYTDQVNPTLRRITVAGLQEQLSTAHALSDGEIAKQLSDLELVERLSDEKLTSWVAELRGKQARQALTALADLSAFLEPPPEEASSDPPPDKNTQRHMISLTAEYLHSTMPRLPDFFAKRISVRYEENPEYREGSTLVEPQPIHEVEHSKAEVLYRNGSEILVAKAKQYGEQDRYLITYGTFGPLLRAVLNPIVTPGDLTWGRWEKAGGDGRRAVFRYTVPADESLYQSGGCCLPDGDGTIKFRKQTGYHGEIVIDPATGAILRLTMQADLEGFVPLDRSDIMIAYGPVEIGGKRYICPIRSVSISRARSVPTLREWNDEFKTWGPYTMMLNDFVFQEYHVFRGESRMLTYSTPGASARGETPEPSTAGPSQPH
jgi:VWFA-related protein